MRLENRKKEESYHDTWELIRQVEAERLIRAPGHMKEEILKRSERIDYRLAVQTRRLSKNAEILLYSMKVSAAVAAALLMIFAVPADMTVMKELPVQSREDAIGERMGQGFREMDQMIQKMFWKMKEK